MFEFTDRCVLVIGPDARGRAACDFLRRRGARVDVLAESDTPELREVATGLRASGFEVCLGATSLPEKDYAFVIVGGELSATSPLALEAAARNLPVFSELELGFHQANCLTIAITGTNGKSTTAGLVARLLTGNQRRVMVCGHEEEPACAVAERNKDLDFLVLQAGASQLEWTQLLRPSVAVVLNLSADEVGLFPDAAAYARACARLLRDQQAFDWAVIQSEARERLRQLDLPVPAKMISFSATDPAADLYLDRGLILSRLPNWTGPLLDTDHCELRGPHNAENLMAALAVGHVLRLSLENMIDPLKTCVPGAHRFELVAEINGVQFVNDAKASNAEALRKALQAARPGRAGEANVWLIAGGRDTGSEFHDTGPLLSQRVKRAFLVGEASEKIRSAWSLFTPCSVGFSLVEAVAEAARNAVSGDVVLLSPACSSFDQFRNHQERGELFCRTVKSIGRGAPVGTPNLHGETVEI